jgi:hypothetical protein
VLLRASQR